MRGARGDSLPTAAPEMAGIPPPGWGRDWEGVKARQCTWVPENSLSAVALSPPEEPLAISPPPRPAPIKGRERTGGEGTERSGGGGLSLYKLVGEGEDRRRDRQAERLGSLEIDYQLKPGRLLDRQ